VAGRERDVERLLTFVDAIVAIAITLLVLPLAEVGREVQDGDVAGLLREHVDDIIGFLLSFVVIARLWLAQHAIVSCLVRQSAAVVGLLVVWTFTIVVLPFPTALIAATSQDTLARVLYIGTMTVSSAMLALIARVIGRDRHLRDTDAAPDHVHATTTTAVFLLALAISVVFPATSYWPLLLLVLVDPVVGRVQARRARTDA
jgi:uncharacterized membrane protein